MEEQSKNYVGGSFKGNFIGVTILEIYQTLSTSYLHPLKPINPESKSYSHNFKQQLNPIQT